MHVFGAVFGMFLAAVAADRGTDNERLAGRRELQSLKKRRKTACDLLWLQATYGHQPIV